MSDLVKRLIALEMVVLPGQPFTLRNAQGWFRRNSDIRKEAAARIEALEAAIIAAMQERDEDMRPILRKALHGEGEGCS